jgi:FkbM family methyltransferase
MMDYLERFHAYSAAFDPEEVIRRHAVRDLVGTPGMVTNFLGVLTDPQVYPIALTAIAGAVEPPPIPANWHCDMSEWGAVLRAVDLAGSRFTIIELGCAWGCWLCNAGVAARRSGREVSLIGVEGDDVYFDIAKRQLEMNGFSAADFQVLRGIAAGVDGTALFPRQMADARGFGSAPVFGATDAERDAAIAAGSHDVLDMLALSRITAQHERIDLLHIDIQGGEADLIDAAIDTLVQKVAYVFVGTHGRLIEGRIYETMLRNGFRLEIERPAILTLDNPAGPVLQFDGVQGWRNKALT